MNMYPLYTQFQKAINVDGAINATTFNTNYEDAEAGRLLNPNGNKWIWLGQSHSRGNDCALCFWYSGNDNTANCFSLYLWNSGNVF